MFDDVLLFCLFRLLWGLRQFEAVKFIWDFVENLVAYDTAPNEAHQMEEFEPVAKDVYVLPLHIISAT